MENLDIDYFARAIRRVMVFGRAYGDKEVVALARSAHDGS
jgi:hypothetical protein